MMSMYYGKDSRSNKSKNSKLLPIILLAASAAAIVAMVILWFYGIYFFFFFLPLTFSLPWSINRLWQRRARKRWNVEDLR
jgi:Flp pilus assembly protein TadB